MNDYEDDDDLVVAMEACLVEKKPEKPQDEEMDVLHSAASSGNSPLVKSLLEKGEDPEKTRRNGWTALHYAVRSGDIQSVKLLIEWGDKRLLNLKTKSGLTSLHIAALEADVEMCKLLIDSGVDIKASNILGQNALQVACIAGNLGVVQYLAEQKIFNIEEKSRFKRNLLHYSVRSNRLDLLEYIYEKGISINDRNLSGNTPLLTAAATGSLEVFKFFIEKGADLKATNSDEFDALFLAAKYGNLDVVKYLLNLGKFDVNRKTSKGHYPLLLASVNDNLKVIECLLEAGADINLRGVHGFTPCLAAALHANVETLKLLVERGADLHVVDNMLADPFQIACDSDDIDKIKYLVSIGKYDLKRRNVNEKTAWIKSSRHESLEVKKFLIELGANIHDTDKFNLGGMVLAAQFSTPENCQFMLDIGLGFDVLTKDGGNALHQTCVSGNLATAKFILGLKCLNVNATMKSGKTALMIAAGRGHLELVKLLLENGADINIRNDYGSLAFHAAAATGDLKTVEYLLSISETGSLLEDRNKRGETPLILSCRNIYTKVFRYLLNAGANLQAVDYGGRNVFLSACWAGNHIVAKHLVENCQFDPSAVTKHGENAVHCAASNRSFNKDILKYLIEDLKIDVNHRAIHDQTPLMVAAEFGCARTCRFLIENGADVQAEMKNWENALFCACLAKNFNLAKIKLLIETGKICVNKKNYFGRTVFHLAVRIGLLEVVKFFVEEANADLEVEDTNGWTLLHVAAKFASLEVNEYLVNTQESLLYRQNSRNQFPRDLAKENDDVGVLLYFNEKMKRREQPAFRTGGGRGRINPTDNLFTPRNRDYNHSLFSTNWRT
ncbi:ankyrin-3-like isoform X2 [Cloeon dipterum]